MTPSLLELQQAFAAAVYDDATAVLSHVRDGAFPAARHLQVYRNNTFANLTEALAAIHPVVQRLVGAEFFEHAADRFIRRHPPRSGNLHDFGRELADFLAAFEPVQSLPYLPDVARLEWRWHEAFHAAHAGALAVETLSQVPPEQYGGLRFQLHPSARLLASAYPVLSIWEANQPGADPEASVNLDAGADRLLIVRRGLEVQIERLGPGEHALLSACASAQPLAAMFEAALAVEPSFDLAFALQRCVQSAVITGFRLSDSPSP